MPTGVYQHRKGYKLPAETRAKIGAYLLREHGLPVVRLTEPELLAMEVY